VRERRRKHTRRETRRRAGLRRRSPLRQPTTIPYNVPRPIAELEPATLHVPNWLSSAHQHQLLRLWASTLVHAGTDHVAPIANRRCPPARTVVLVGDDALNSRYAAGDETDAARLPSWLTGIAQTAARAACDPERRAGFRPDLGLLGYLAPAARASASPTPPICSTARSCPSASALTASFDYTTEKTAVAHTPNGASAPVTCSYSVPRAQPLPRPRVRCAGHRPARHRPHHRPTVSHTRSRAPRRPANSALTRRVAIAAPAQPHPLSGCSCPRIPQFRGRRSPSQRRQSPACDLTLRR
jgi:hypothetical protein